MNDFMNHKLIILFIILIFSFSCSKKEVEINKPTGKEKAFEVYQEAVDAMDRGEYFFASGKFKDAEEIMPKMELAAKSSIMASYCLYLINFYEEADLYLERFIKRYPVDKNIPYVYYLIAINSYEQILDEKPLKKGVVYLIPSILYNDVVSNIEFDIFFNSASLSEMDKKICFNYIEMVNKKSPDHILHCNSNFLAFPDSKIHIEVLARDFPFDSKTYNLIYQHVSPFQGASGRYRIFQYNKKK